MVNILALLSGGPSHMMASPVRAEQRSGTRPFTIITTPPRAIFLKDIIIMSSETPNTVFLKDIPWDKTEDPNGTQ